MYIPIQTVAGAGDVVYLEELFFQLFVARADIAILIFPFVTGSIARPFSESRLIEALIVERDRRRPLARNGTLRRSLRCGLRGGRLIGAGRIVGVVHRVECGLDLSEALHRVHIDGEVLRDGMG